MPNSKDKYAPRKLTEKFILELKWDGKPRMIRDTEVRGLAVAINKGSKSFKIQADLWTGKRGQSTFIRTVRKTLGRVEDLSIKEARSLAYGALSQIKNGIDPFSKLSPGKTVLEAQTVPSTSPAQWTVESMFENYIDDLKYRERSHRTIVDVEYVLRKYLSAWKKLRAVDIRKSDAKALHKSISVNHGKTVANHTLRYFRAAYNFADTECDEDEFCANPVRAVKFHTERSSGRALLSDELKCWKDDLFTLTNPLRREMHLLQLLSGLRPVNIKEIEKSWMHVEKMALEFPKMKSRREFHLPLSTQMVECIERAQQISTLMFPGSTWLFPTVLRSTGKVGPVAVTRERTMPSQTGHILRHTHRNISKIVGVDDISAKMLLDHKVPGIDGVYLHNEAQFAQLLKHQQAISDKIFELMRLSTKDGALIVH